MVLSYSISDSRANKTQITDCRLHMNAVDVSILLIPLHGGYETSDGGSVKTFKQTLNTHITEGHSNF
jgi:hypothetical protein